jgi:hypothetical protein
MHMYMHMHMRTPVWHMHAAQRRYARCRVVPLRWAGCNVCRAAGARGEVRVALVLFKREWEE